MPGGGSISHVAQDSDSFQKSSAILQWCALNGDQIAVDLEPGVVPTMIVTSAADVINEDEIDSLKEQHNVPDEWHLKMNSDLTRVSMLQESSCYTLNNVILNWVEDSVM
mmetsp:Transcript_9053/g.13478  ORF Transcript_9053/g.13478 Transcript_9053/m.13478 type:complete len:109 (-) Transcript_9053:1820-2146(-)